MTMRIEVERKWPKKDYIIGRLYIDGSYVCNTLERPWLSNKPQVSCIPTGIYDVIVAQSPRFGRELPRILNVPSRSGVLIHRGNYVTDSTGCILVGENKAKGAVLNSAKWEKELTIQMKLAALRGEKVILNIHN